MNCSDNFLLASGISSSISIFDIESRAPRWDGEQLESSIVIFGPEKDEWKPHNRKYGVGSKSIIIQYFGGMNRHLPSIREKQGSRVSTHNQKYPISPCILNVGMSNFQ